jgi:hypothetical protein
MNLLSLDNLQAALEEYGAKAVELYKMQLALGGKNASHALADSVTAHVETTEGAYEVRVTLLDYWKYIEGGSQGKESSPLGAIYPAHFPPPRILERWIEVKPVIPRPGKNGRIPTPKQLSWMIARSIERRGIEPFPAMATTIEELNRQYKDVLAVALAKDVTNYIAKLTTLDRGAMSQAL